MIEVCHNSDNCSYKFDVSVKKIVLTVYPEKRNYVDARKNLK